MYREDYRTKAGKLRKLAQRAAGEQTRRKLLVREKHYEQLSAITEDR